MAFISVVHPCRSVYISTRLHGVGRAENDGEFRANLRLIAAIVLAQWSETNPNLLGVRGEVFDVVTSAPFYEQGFAKTVRRDFETQVEEGDFIDALFPDMNEHFREDAKLWFCSYIGFEKVTSEWAKKNHPDCHGYICMRVYNQDALHKVLDSHTIQIYF
jgi:hypothetical protein